MEKLNLEQAVEYHRFLWREIARRIKEEGVDEIFSIPDLKHETIRGMGLHEHPFNECFLCDYGYQKTYSFVRNCDFCPLFDNTKKPDDCLNGLYERFWDGFIGLKYEGKDNHDLLYETALQIAELPIVNRKGEEVE